jgi:hypothetical protein
MRPVVGVALSKASGQPGRNPALLDEPSATPGRHAGPLAPDAKIRSLPFLCTVACYKYMCVILQISFAQRQILTNRSVGSTRRFLSINHLHRDPPPQKSRDLIQNTFRSFREYHRADSTGSAHSPWRVLDFTLASVGRTM